MWAKSNMWTVSNQALSIRQKQFLAFALCHNPPIADARVESSQCHLPGMVLSQTTLTPAVTDTTLSENVPTLTVTPVILSSTTPGCSEFNTSTCEPCGPGSQYDNSKSVTGSSDARQLLCIAFCFCAHRPGEFCFGMLNPS